MHAIEGQQISMFVFEDHFIQIEENIGESQRTKKQRNKRMAKRL